jgi:hypothetical protein
MARRGSGCARPPRRADRVPRPRRDSMPRWPPARRCPARRARPRCRRPRGDRASPWRPGPPPPRTDPPRTSGLHRQGRGQAVEREREWPEGLVDDDLGSPVDHPLAAAGGDEALGAKVVPVLHRRGEIAQCHAVQRRSGARPRRRLDAVNEGLHAIRNCATRVVVEDEILVLQPQRRLLHHGGQAADEPVRGERRWDRRLVLPRPDRGIDRRAPAQRMVRAQQLERKLGGGRARQGRGVAAEQATASQVPRYQLVAGPQVTGRTGRR